MRCWNGVQEAAEVKAALARAKDMEVARLWATQKRLEDRASELDELRARRLPFSPPLTFTSPSISLHACRTDVCGARSCTCMPLKAASEGRLLHQFC